MRNVMHDFLCIRSRVVYLPGEWSGKTAGGAAKPMRRGSVSRLQKDGQVTLSPYSGAIFLDVCQRNKNKRFHFVFSLRDHARQ